MTIVSDAQSNGLGFPEGKYAIARIEAVGANVRNGSITDISSIRHVHSLFFLSNAVE